MTARKKSAPEEPVTALATIEPMKQAIAVATEAGDIQTLKDTAAMASGLKEAAKKRGMGIQQENKAAEVIIRAERGMGQVLNRMYEEGLLAKQGQSQTGKQRPVNEQRVRLLTLADLGFESPAERVATQRFQLLARLSDEDFEGLIAYRRSSEERIAKVDFYRLAAPPKPAYTPPGYAEGQSVPPTEQVDPVFAALRDATRQAFGWQPDGEGGGTYTSNALLNMHVDDLAQVAAFVQQWATGYAEAKSARRAA